MEKVGIKNTLQLHDANDVGNKTLTERVGINQKKLSEILALSDLSRIQWVSPTFSRVLVAAGFTDAANVSKADPELLYKAVIRANENARFYKGKVGLRDIKRLIAAAAYVQG